ncbi:MAG: SsrA-binding protein SmpB [Alphaproteobacteria bacterium]|nr:SsrA-binding protein SmpB [Alphaproteobacteria bacterium SS10]
MAKESSALKRKVVAQNRRARFDYFIDETLEAGIMLTGTEVKSLRFGRASINESYASVEEGELYLINGYIPEYTHAHKSQNHESTRPRKLLVSKKQLNNLIGRTRERGVTLVPISLYFNPRGMAKLEIGVARGKKQHDKRETIKERDWQRQKSRLLRENS